MSDGLESNHLFRNTETRPYQISLTHEHHTHPGLLPLEQRPGSGVQEDGSTPGRSSFRRLIETRARVRTASELMSLTLALRGLRLCRSTCTRRTAGAATSCDVC